MDTLVLRAAVPLIIVIGWVLDLAAGIRGDRTRVPWTVPRHLCSRSTKVIVSTTAAPGGVELQRYIR
jgi:hypothetical protein